MTTIILAAGLSERMGCNKLLLPWKGVPVIVHTAENALSFSRRVIVVTGHERGLITEALEHRGVEFVHNPRYREGQKTSILRGVEEAEGDDFCVLPGDLPLLDGAVAAPVFRLLEASFAARAVWNGIPGHPVAFRKENRERLLAFPGTMKEYLGVTGCLYAEGSVSSVFDIDTPGRYSALMASDGNLSVLESHIRSSGH